MPNFVIKMKSTLNIYGRLNLFFIYLSILEAEGGAYKYTYTRNYYQIMNYYEIMNYLLQQKMLYN